MGDDIFKATTSVAEPTGPRELFTDVIERVTKQLGPPRDCGPLPVVVSPRMTGTKRGTGWVLLPPIEVLGHIQPSTLVCSDEYLRELQLNVEGGIVDLAWFRARRGGE